MGARYGVIVIVKAFFVIVRTSGDAQTSLEGFFDRGLVRFHRCFRSAVQLWKLFRLRRYCYSLRFSDADCVGVAGYFLEAIAAERSAVP